MRPLILLSCNTSVLSSDPKFCPEMSANVATQLKLPVVESCDSEDDEEISNIMESDCSAYDSQHSVDRYCIKCTYQFEYGNHTYDFFSVQIIFHCHHRKESQTNELFSFRVLFT